MTVANDLIYDVGMHNGDDTAYYLARGFRVVAIEADPVQAKAGCARFAKEIEAGRLVILNIAIAETERIAEFWVNETSPQLNSFNREAAARFGNNVHSISVPCTRLDLLLLQYGVPHYLKIDIEGNDIVCCQQLTPDLRPKYVSVEMWQIELLLRLRDIGYDRFMLVNQRTLRPVSSHNIPTHVRVLRRIHRAANYRLSDRSVALRLARFVAASILRGASGVGLWGSPPPFRSKALPKWSFEEGCSGTYGEDLPDKWMDWKEVAYLWHRDEREHQMIGLEYWADVHATCSIR
jgi:FkbM family methyltransferase